MVALSDIYFVFEQVCKELMVKMKNEQNGFCGTFKNSADG
jgi:hypothetical protein